MESWKEDDVIKSLRSSDTATAGSPGAFLSAIAREYLDFFYGETFPRNQH